MSKDPSKVSATAAPVYAPVGVTGAPRSRIYVDQRQSVSAEKENAILKQLIEASLRIQKHEMLSDATVFDDFQKKSAVCACARGIDSQTASQLSKRPMTTHSFAHVCDCHSHCCGASKKKTTTACVKVKTGKCTHGIGSHVSKKTSDIGTDSCTCCGAPPTTVKTMTSSTCYCVAPMPTKKSAMDSRTHCICSAVPPTTATTKPTAVETADTCANCGEKKLKVDVDSCMCGTGISTLSLESVGETDFEPPFWWFVLGMRPFSIGPHVSPRLFGKLSRHMARVYSPSYHYWARRMSKKFF